MTKAEVRALVLCKAKIATDAMVIDIGAGTGSLSVEAALMAPQGHVYAIEREPEGIALIEANSKKFKVENLTAICGAAPKALDNLPQADTILIGGSGGSLPAILENCDLLLKETGRLVLTAITLETVTNALSLLSQKNYEMECFQMQVNRLKKVGSYHMFDALNPIFVLTCWKKVKGGVKC